jgi:opacity protein-like surface antigen
MTRAAGLRLAVRVMRMMPVALAAAALAAPAAAQYRALPKQDKPVMMTVGGAAAVPLSDSADRFSTGLGATIGAAWNVTDQATVRFDYVRSRLSAQDDWPRPALAQSVDVKPRIQFVTAAFMFQGPPGRVRPYILAGVGLYRRSVALSASGSGSLSVCDPWWFVCNSGEVSADRLTGSRSSTDIGVNVGTGVRYGMFFAEIRYHFTWGPQFSTSVGSQRATGKFLPLAIGVIF